MSVSGQKLASSFDTILCALRHHASTQPDKVAYTFLLSETERVTWTFQELHQRVQVIGAHLLNHARPGDRALLTYAPGLEFIEAFLGCLAAGIVPVPAYPPKLNRNADRVLAIARDCDPRLLLCASNTRSNIIGDFAKQIPQSSVLVTDELSPCESEVLPNISPESLAFLQYTSGSTSNPKGVMVSHRNLIANELAIQQAFDHDSTSIFCGWLPTFHDMGLIGIVLQPLFVGIPSILMSPVSFLASPVQWLKMISDYRVTTTGGPNFAYEHCLSQIEEADCTDLDLSCWKVAFNGAEPVRRSTLDRFAQRFVKCGFQKEAFFPCFGLAESTLFVSGRHYQSENNSICRTITFDSKGSHSQSNAFVDCGPVAQGLEVVVVSPESSERLSEGQVGEIWIRGSSIADGYWNSPDTDNAFRSYFSAQGDTESYLRTGDLGYLANGHLYVTGRLKDLIIIRGRNIYPQDVEQIAERHLQFSGSTPQTT